MSIADNTLASPYVMFISSNNRISGTNSDFQSMPIDLGLNKYDSVCLVQASIPRSFYNIPLNFNQFTLKEGLSSAIVTIPIGTYNRINLQSVLQTQLNQSSPNGWIYNISYPNKATSADTYKYTFSVSGNSSQPQFIFTDKLFRQLGFEHNSTNVFVGNTLTSTNCINLAYATRAFIKSNICTGTEILQEIQNYGSFPMLSIAFFEQQDYDLNTRQYNPINFNSWTFTLVDQFDEIIDLNGVTWGMSIVLYCRSNTHEILKNDLAFKNEERLIELQKSEDELKTKLQTNYTGESMQTNMLEPIFPVKPYYSSTSIDLTPQNEEIKTDVKEKKIQKK